MSVTTEKLNLTMVTDFISNSMMEFYNNKESPYSDSK